jgi:hypothetical protein
MFYAVLAVVVLLVHLAFILFVALGGFLVLRWRWTMWLHLPAALWGTLIMFAGWICPLTPLENHLWRLAGAAGYEGGFIEHYLTSLIYPEGLTRTAQVLIGLAVLILNGTIYGHILVTSLRRRKSADSR